jgi:hypothetical protein
VDVQVGGGSADDRQVLRRVAAMKALTFQTLTQKSSATVEKKTISDRAFIELMGKPESWEDEGFTPIAAYRDKIDGIRYPYPGEVGVIEKNGKVTYLFLEEGFGKGFVVRGRVSSDEAAEFKKLMDAHSGNAVVLPTDASIEIIDLKSSSPNTTFCPFCNSVTPHKLRECSDEKGCFVAVCLTCNQTVPHAHDGEEGSADGI